MLECGPADGGHHMPQGQRMTLRKIAHDGDVLGALLAAVAFSGAIWFVAANEDLVRRILNYNPFS